MYFKRQLSDDKGFAVAEFAVTVPILISMLSMCVWVIGISIKKYELENYVNNVARLVARGEAQSDTLEKSAPFGTEIQVSQTDNQIYVEANLVQHIPVFNKEIHLSATAQSMLETYETEE